MNTTKPGLAVQAEYKSVSLPVTANHSNADALSCMFKILSAPQAPNLNAWTQTLMSEEALGYFEVKQLKCSLDEVRHSCRSTNMWTEAAVQTSVFVLSVKVAFMCVCVYQIILADASVVLYSVFASVFATVWRVSV